MQKPNIFHIRSVTREYPKTATKLSISIMKPKAITQN